jgi:hypothetical protein
MAPVRNRWERWSDDRLLAMRFCDLKLRIEGTWLEPIVERVGDELAERGLRFRPHFWLADEWFSPDGVPGVALPFYLASERLMELERSLMYEVEGGTRRDCSKLVRHEVGHAVDTAYRIHRRKRYRELFGSRSQKYPDLYRPRPGSKRYVQHLGGWYAQSHPAEDFAETFAVWLTPRSSWRSKYARWGAIKKLEFMDEVMEELAGKPPAVRCRERPYSLSKLRHSLRKHYDKKRESYAVGYSDVYDRDLTRLFTRSDEAAKNPTAASVLRKRKKQIRERVAKWTGAYEFTVDAWLQEMIGRCRELKLRIRTS